MPKISALSAGGALAGTEVVPVVQAGATVKSTIDDIATRVIASDAELAAIAGLTSAADRGIYFTGSGTASLFTFTAAGRALLDDANAAAQLTTLGLSANGSSLVTAANYAAMRGLLDLEAGTDFNAYSALLADIAGITFAQGDVIYYNGSNLVKLAAGTSGQFLKTQGAGANPTWALPSGGTIADGDYGDVAVSSSGAVFTIENMTVAATVTASGTPAVNAVGYLGSPQMSDQDDYTLVMGDAGKHYYHVSGTPHTLTIPANASVAFPIGTVIVIVNENGGGDLSIAITSDTLRWGSSTGTRTLAADGTATLLKVTSTAWRLTGDGIT